MSLQDKKVLIIGGTSGIGRATAEAASAAGAHVVVGGRSAERGDKVKHALPEAEYCEMDVRDPRGLDYCLEQIGAFDHLVITAVELERSLFLETDMEAARRVFETKFWGTYAAVQTAARSIRKGGSITLFSGLSAAKPVRGLSIIAAANGAVEALMRSLAVELSPIRVNAIRPGTVDTTHMDSSRREKIASVLPASRVGEATDVAEAVLFVIQNPYMTGSIITVDGGGMLV